VNDCHFEFDQCRNVNGRSNGGCAFISGGLWGRRPISCRYVGDSEREYICRNSIFIVRCLLAFVFFHSKIFCMSVGWRRRLLTTLVCYYILFMDRHLLFESRFVLFLFLLMTY